MTRSRDLKSRRDPEKRMGLHKRKFLFIDQGQNHVVEKFLEELGGRYTKELHPAFINQLQTSINLVNAKKPREIGSWEEETLEVLREARENLVNESMSPERYIKLLSEWEHIWDGQNNKVMPGPIEFAKLDDENYVKAAQWRFGLKLQYMKARKEGGSVAEKEPLELEKSGARVFDIVMR